MSSQPVRSRVARLCLLLLALAMLSTGWAQEQPGSNFKSRGLSEDQIPVEVFTSPRPKKIHRAICETWKNPERKACDALREGFGGWVQLGFMVDPSGKPFEVTVIRSTGNKTFDRVATESIERSTFEPASLDGMPIESGLEMKYVFRNFNLGMTHDFVAVYSSLMRAIKEGDRAAADSAMETLKVSNLSEDAYAGLAAYNYASKWGDESQQLEGLRRAIAEANEPYYLPPDVYWSTLLTRMKLELQTQRYAEALATWKHLQKSPIERSAKAPLEAIVEKLQKLRSDDSAYEVTGLIADTDWHLHLFKRHFRAEVVEGHISQVKLRCDRHYRFFTFDPTLQYEVSSKDGECSIELEGAPGTRFKLIQF
jgi:TonB family protein